MSQYYALSPRAFNFMPSSTARSKHLPTAKSQLYVHSTRTSTHKRNVAAAVKPFFLNAKRVAPPAIYLSVSTRLLQVLHTLIPHDSSPKIEWSDNMCVFSIIHVKTFFPPVDIQYTQCPCGVFILERYKLCGHKLRHMYIVMQQRDKTCHYNTGYDKQRKWNSNQRRRCLAWKGVNTKQILIVLVGKTYVRTTKVSYLRMNTTACCVRVAQTSVSSRE